MLRGRGALQPERDSGRRLRDVHHSARPRHHEGRKVRRPVHCQARGGKGGIHGTMGRSTKLRFFLWWGIRSKSIVNNAGMYSTGDPCYALHV